MLAALFLIFLVLAFVCFVAEAVRSRSLVAAGLACWVLVPLINQFRSMV